MGGVTSTPVINRPEVAIIAVNKVEEKVVVIDGEIEVRKRMNLSLSLRPPRGRRLGRRELHAGAEGLHRKPAAAAQRLMRAGGAAPLLLGSLAVLRRAIFLWNVGALPGWPVEMSHPSVGAGGLGWRGRIAGLGAEWYSGAPGFRPYLPLVLVCSESSSKGLSAGSPRAGCICSPR